MAKLHDDWTVFPHGPVEPIDDGILSVEGEIHMPLGRFPRRMTVAALRDGGIVVFSPLCLDERAMRDIEMLGKPRFMVVPNGFHRLDTRPWKKRYPDIKVICPPCARTRVEKAVAVDAVTDIMADDQVKFIVVDGVRRAESALTIRRTAGTTLVVNDLISHIRHPRGFGAKLISRLMGFGVERPQMAREVRWLLVNDKGALARQLRLWAAMPDLRRIILSHGQMIEVSPAAALESIALTLD